MTMCNPFIISNINFYSHINTLVIYLGLNIALFHVDIFA